MIGRDGRSSPQQANVLLVDDDSASVRVHRTMLEALGHHVINAADASVALTIAQQAPPRIIFLGTDGSGSACRALSERRSCWRSGGTTRRGTSRSRCFRVATMRSSAPG
jgi:ActR/RegA family two-component response regulator